MSKPDANITNIVNISPGLVIIAAKQENPKRVPPAKPRMFFELKILPCSVRFSGSLCEKRLSKIVMVKIDSETKSVDVGSDMWQEARAFCHGEAAIRKLAIHAKNGVLRSEK